MGFGKADKSNPIKLDIFEIIRNGTVDSLNEIQNAGAILRNSDFLKLLNQLDTNRMSPLHYAVQLYNLPAVRILLECGADVNRAGEEHDTPLMLGVHCRNKKAPTKDELAKENALFDIFVKHNVNLNQQNDYKQGVIHYAIMKNNVNFLKKLLKQKDLNIDLEDCYLMNAVHYSVYYKNESILKILIEAKCSLVSVNIHGDTPLHLSAYHESDKICKILLDELKKQYSNKISKLIDMNNSQHQNPLLVSIEKGNFRVTEVLINASSTLSNKNFPLHYASRFKSLAIMEYLISLKFDVNAKNSKDEQPLHIATFYNVTQNIEILLKNDADIEGRNTAGLTPLMIAALRGNLESLNVLLNNNANTNSVNNCGRNSLMIAAESNHCDVVKVLLDLCPPERKNDYINSLDFNDWTPLIIACDEGHHEVVDFLLKNGADPSHKEKDQKTALICGVENGHYEAVKTLLDYDYNLIFQEYEFPKCPYHYIINEEQNKYENDMGITDPTERRNRNEMYMQTEITINQIRDVVNITSLQIASQKGYSKIVQLLLDKGADVKIKDSNGLNSLDRAIVNEHRDVVKIILNSKRWDTALDNKYYCPNSQMNMTPMLSLIEKMPDVAYEILSRSVTVSNNFNNHPKFEITYNYRFISCIASFTSYGDTKNLRESDDRAPLEWMVKYKRSKLILHPLSKQLISNQWNTYGSYLVFSNLLISILFTLVLSLYLYLTESPSVDDKSLTGCPASNYIKDTKPASDVFKYISLMFAALLAIRELVQFKRSPKKYFCWKNLFEFTFIILCLVSLIDSTRCNRETGIREGWQWQMATASVFLSCISIIATIEKVSSVGIYAAMFFHILKTLLRFSIVLILFLVSFGICFHFLLFNQSEFQGLFTFLKTAVMMTGEIDYGDIFGSSGDVPYPYVTYPLFVVFIIFMSIVVMNLMVGLAIDDIQAIRDNAELQKLKKQIKVNFKGEKLLKYNSFVRNLNYYYYLIIGFGPRDVDNFVDEFHPNHKNKYCCFFEKYDKPVGYNVEDNNEIFTNKTDDEQLGFEELKSEIDKINEKLEVLLAKDEQI